MLTKVFTIQISNLASGGEKLGSKERFEVLAQVLDHTFLDSYMPNMLRNAAAGSHLNWNTGG